MGFLLLNLHLLIKNEHYNYELKEFKESKEFKEFKEFNIVCN